MVKHQKSHNKPYAGFTLVELAIVMIIIGLLITGVLKGQQMIINARITSTISQVQSYRAANTSFQDMYRALPGDMSTATARLPGCTAANNCFDGNGDGILGTITTNYSHDDQSANLAVPAIETSMYWKHLAAAGLIKDVNPSSDPMVPAWNSTHPSGKIDGGFHVLTANETGNNQASGFYYILRMNATGDPHPTAPGIEVLSPIQARNIDTKIDDGIANRGELRCDDAGAMCSTAVTGVYSTPSERKDCLMIFSFR